METKETKSKRLERKTKKELIEIIFRKDSVEQNQLLEIAQRDKIINGLRADMKGTEDTLLEVGDKLDALSIEYDHLNNDFEKICDDYVSYKTHVRGRTYLHRSISCILFILFIIALIF